MDGLLRQNVAIKNNWKHSSSYRFVKNKKQKQTVITFGEENIHTFLYVRYMLCIQIYLKHSTII